MTPHPDARSAPILLSPPHLSGDELPQLAQSLAEGWLAPAGPWLDRFEGAVADTLTALGAPTRPHVAALSSGTAALHLALRLVGVQPGDAVLSASLTFVGAVNPIVYLGAEPVFIDSEAATYGLDPTRAEQAITTLTREGRRIGALVITHLYGRAAALDQLLPLAAAHGIPVIEDAAEALGATHTSRPLGTLGTLSVYSFNGNKVISTGGGGALVGADAAHIAQARALAAQARLPAPHYEHAELGYNYRLSSLAAAVGLGQLPHLSAYVTVRRAIHAHYSRALSHLPGVQLPQLAAGDSAWLTTLHLDPATARATPEQLRLALAEARIEARPIWKPMHLQPLYRSARLFGGTVAERLFSTGLCLPSGSALTTAQLERICAVITRVLS